MASFGVITIEKSDVNGKDHGQKSMVKFTEVKTNVDPIWAFPDRNYSLNSQMAKKYCINVKMTYDYFSRHPSNVKVTRAEKSTILTRNEHFGTVIPVWIHIWLCNDGQSMKWHRRCGLLFFEVICLMPRSQGPFQTSKMQLCSYWIGEWINKFISLFIGRILFRAGITVRPCY